MNVAAARKQLHTLSNFMLHFVVLSIGLLLTIVMSYYLHATEIMIAAIASVIVAELLPPLTAKVTGVLKRLTGIDHSTIVMRFYEDEASTDKHILFLRAYVPRATQNMVHVLARIVAVVLPVGKVVHDQLKREERDVYVPILLGQPIYYISWYNLGMLVAAVVHAEGELTTFPTEICYPMATYILLRGISDVLGEKGRTTLRGLRLKLPVELCSSLSEVTSIPNHSEEETTEKIAELKQFVVDRGSSVSYFYSDWTALIESFFRLAITVLVMLVISWKAGAIAVVALVLSSVVIFHDLISGIEDSTTLKRLHARLRNLTRHDGNPHLQPLLHDIAVPDAYEGALRRLNNQIEEHEATTNREAHWRRAVTLMLYIGMTGVGATIPVLAASNEEISLRLALLFLFSTISSWQSCYRSTRCGFELARCYCEMNEELELLGFVLTKGERGEASEPDSHVPVESSEMRVGDETTVGYDNCRPILRVREFSIPPTIGDAQVVKVVAERSGLGSSALLKLLTGRLPPRSDDGLYFGSLNVTELSREAKRKQLLLLPDKLGPFEGIRVAEFYADLCGFDLEALNEEDARDFRGNVSKVLTRFGLGKELRMDGNPDYTGANTLIRPTINHLRDNVHILNWMAITYGVIAFRRKDPDFQPKVIAIDGIHHLSEDKQLRESIVDSFEYLCSELHATLVVTICRGDKIQEEDFVLTIESPENAYVDDRRANSEMNVVVGDYHGMRYGTVHVHRGKHYRRLIAPQK